MKMDIVMEKTVITNARLLKKFHPQKLPNRLKKKVIKEIIYKEVISSDKIKKI
jgi:hypothetical protein